MTASVFGTPLRDQILAILAISHEQHASELARLIGVSEATIGRAVGRLERDGLLAAVTHGRTRLLRLNPRWYAKQELRALLDRMTEAQPELYEAAGALRRRPRRRGKPL